MPIQFNYIASGGAVARTRRYGETEVQRRCIRRHHGCNAGGDNADGFNNTRDINKDVGCNNTVDATNRSRARVARPRVLPP